MKNASCLMLLLFFTACQSQELQTVTALDVQQYAGTWYEIARLPNRFEKDLDYVTATYELMENGKIKVINRGISISEAGKKSEITGKAWVPDPEQPGKLKVQFFWPFAGKYWVIALDQEYRNALVGDPSRKYLWILSKDKQLNPDTYLALVKTAKDNGFETDKLVLIKQ